MGEQLITLPRAYLLSLPGSRPDSWPFQCSWPFHRSAVIFSIVKKDGKIKRWYYGTIVPGNMLSFQDVTMDSCEILHHQPDGWNNLSPLDVTGSTDGSTEIRRGSHFAASEWSEWSGFRGERHGGFGVWSRGLRPLTYHWEYTRPGKRAWLT